MTGPDREPQPDDLLYWLWLARALGPGSLCAGRVLEQFGDARAAWNARKTATFRQAAGDGPAFRANRPENAPENFRAFTRRCVEKHIQILPCDDPDYPERFQNLPDRPVVIYCTGNPVWLNGRAMVGMVGTRKPSPYGRQAAGEIGRGLAGAGAVIVSGLADGLDSAGHEAALEKNAPTVAVLGVPIDRMYPAANRERRGRIEQKGCVISEYPPESEPVGRNGFLQRNRLIAALSDALVVVEAQEKSGTMSTVEHAERYGRPVFAVPGNIYARNSRGTNALLRDGRARAVCEAEDLFELLGLHPVPQQRKPVVSLNEKEQKVLDCMDIQKPKGVEELSVRSSLPVPVLLSTLTMLNIKKCVIELPGKRYIRSGSANNDSSL